MSSEVKVLLIFCEGRHDVYFVKKVFEHGFKYKRVCRLFKDFPVPFNQLLPQTITNFASKDLYSYFDEKFFLPDYYFEDDEAQNLVMVFNSGGENRVGKLKELLGDYLFGISQKDQIDYQASSKVTAVKYLFIYDADDRGLDTKARFVADNFSRINEDNFIQLPWKSSAKSPFGKISDNKAVYVWGETEESGTLEDIIYPMFESDENELIRSAENAIGSVFPGWKPNNVSGKAKKKKAIITLAGQKEKPGQAMSIIFGESRLIKEKTFVESEKIKIFIDFLKEFGEIS